MRAERPLAVITSKSLISSGGPQTGSELAKVVQSTEIWLGKHRREGAEPEVPGGGGGGGSFKFTGGSSQLLSPSPLMPTQLLAFT